ncbi:MAG: hypothetical protein FJ098_12540 [Deltaproteobacteria bacterium]|nr:hypothetical protein [Deltaproteobacteria bacterium]
MTRRIRSFVGLASAALLGLVAGGCSASRGCTDSPADEPQTRAERCEPSSVYGPKPCHSDEECVKDYGEGWYCDLEHSYSDGCGGRIDWPVCKAR